MKPTIHPAPLTGWHEQFKANDGKSVIDAFIDCNIGVSCTTEAHVMRCPDGKFEARVGFSVFGAGDMNEAEFAACGHSPFHPNFHDNFARAIGDTEADALKALAADLKRIGESLWD